jgi:hypothetical protein
MAKYIPIIEKLRDNVLTHKLLYNPVLANDGNVYEKEALIEFLKQNDYKSPIDKNIKINMKFIDVFQIKSIIDNFINAFPELKKMQYIPHGKYDNNMILQHNEFIDEINEIFSSRNYSDLMKYVNFDISIINTNFDHFIKNASSEIFMYFVNNLQDINAKSCNNVHWPLLNILATCDKEEYFKYVLDKPNININSTCENDGWTVLHQHIRYFPNNVNMIKYIIDKGGLLNKINSSGETALYYIIKYCKDLNLILHAISKLQNIESDEKSILIDRLTRRKDSQDSFMDEITMEILMDAILNK